MSLLARIRNAALALATLVLVSPVRAESIGAPVYLYEPGPITGTLVAAPTMTLPDFWDSAIFYSNPGTGGPGSESAVALFSSTGSSIVGSTMITPSIPTQDNSLFISTFFGTMPQTPPGTQGDATGTFISTGFTSANNRPGGSIIPSASVIFNGNHTALIGFAPPGSPVPDLFTDYPLRILLSNVWDGHAAPVPEPSTWMLFLTGLLAVGLSLRRGRR